MEDKPKKLDLNSMDISAENRAKLKALFPSVFTETVNDKGKLAESIDFEKLKAELGTFSDLFESRRERFGMDWPGKKDCMKLIQEPSRATLKPARDESVNFDGTKNLFIEGDNLEVLKLLQKSYYGKVKMIYIDPPYNTGKEFIYPDKYSESLETYLEYAGLVDGEGRKFSTNTPNEGRFHSKWLNMMYPRLYLARNLLREDGVIFISIDDNEVANLRKLCDEIYGEDNFVANIIWQKKYTRANDAKWFSDNHDHILCYARNKELFRINQLPRNEEQLSAYKNPDNHPKGPWKATPLHAKSGTNTKPYTFKNGITWTPPAGTFRRFNDESMQRMEENDEIWFGDDGKQTPQRKSFLCDVKDGVTPLTLWPYDEAGHNHEANTELKTLGLSGLFNNPKPSRLIKRMCVLSDTPEKDTIVLDFFAGSCTTAHAVLELNKEDGGNRKFIMVQLPEPCDEKSEAFKAGYNTIADIGKERIRRVIKKIEEERASKKKEEQAQLFRTGDRLVAPASPDLGFKVFKLDKSNFKPWEKLDADASEEKIAKQLELHIDHIVPDSSQEDILYEILLKAGFMPTERIEILHLENGRLVRAAVNTNMNRVRAGFKPAPNTKTVFSIAEGALLICLEDEITRELIDAVAEAEPMQFICLDQGFKGNDQLKTNAVQTFAARNQGRDKAGQIVFRTV